LRKRNEDFPETGARKEGSEVLRLFPEYSLEWDSKASFYKDPKYLQQQHDDLRKAGIK
jgi:hypothetical protein